MKKLILTILIMIAATSFGSGNVEIVDEGFRVMSPDGTQIAFLSSEGLGTFENLKDNSLAVNTTVYTTSGKLLTTDIPTTGTLSFWTRTTGPATLTTATAGDKIVTTGTVQGETLTDGTLSINSGSITSAVNGTFSGTVQAEQITSTDDITMEGDLLTLGSGNAAENTVIRFLGGGPGGGVTELEITTNQMTYSNLFIATSGFIGGVQLAGNSVASTLGNDLTIHASSGNLIINSLYSLPSSFGTTGHLVTAAGNGGTMTYTDPATLSVALAAEVTVADESSDETCFPAFFTAATGNLPIRTDADGLTYNSVTQSLGIGGNLTVNGVVGFGTAPVANQTLTVLGGPTGGVIINQGVDDKGFTIFGFDNRSGNSLSVGIDEFGQSTWISSTGVAWTNLSGGVLFDNRAASSTFMQMRSKQGFFFDNVEGHATGHQFRGASNAVLFHIKGDGKVIIPNSLRVGSLDDPVGIASFGDGTNELRVSATGDLSFAGTGGLLYGNMDQDGGVFTVFLETVNQLYELDADTTNISAGPLNDVTFPGNHYLEVKTAGVYKIDWSLICQISGLTGGSEHVEFEVLKNGNATGKGESHVTHKNTVRDFPIASTTLLDLAVDDEISIGATARDSSGKTITIDHLEMTIFMGGGT